MQGAVLLAGMLLLAGTMPLSAQPPESLPAPSTANPAVPMAPPGGNLADTGPLPEGTAAPETPDAAPSAAPVPWETVWGVVGLRGIAAGPRIAPNGYEYHPLFSLDLNFNLWLWRRQGIYLFSDTSFWGEKAENGVTNGHDGGLGFSKREFDLTIGPAWNYYGFWEARLFGYSYNNLNRGLDPVQPLGFNDGFAIENRRYLSQEYSRLGQTGFDVARATFVSFGWYLTKILMDNDGQPFNPGPFLRTYLIYDLGNWPAYAFLDAQFIAEQSLRPKMLLYDLGVAARPFARARQWEFRLGVQNTADFEVHSVLNLWYASIRYIF
jgi:hypothetical protein